MGAVSAQDQQITGLNSGVEYTLTYDISSYAFDVGVAAVYVGSTQGDNDLLNEVISSNGSKSHMFTAGSANWITFITEVGTIFDLDNVVVGIPAPTEAEGITVVWKWNHKPRFYIDEDFFKEGDAVVSPTLDATDLDIGNNNELNDVTPFDLKQAFLGNRPLTKDEVRALLHQARMINQK
jgi:hypothetical protein